MFLKKLSRSRKAISPVIATLLLILVAVASGLVLYSYVMGYLGSMTKGGSSMQGLLSLDSSTADTSSITAYVRNVGSVSVNITSAYLDGAVQSIDSPGYVVISTGNVGTVTLSGLTLQSGTSYTVTLVAKDGTSLVFNVKP